MSQDIAVMNRLQRTRNQLLDTITKRNIPEIFSSTDGTYLNAGQLYIAYYNKLPNYIVEGKINCKKVNNWLLENLKDELKDVYFNKRPFRESKQTELDDIFYFLYDDLLLFLDTGRSEVSFLFRDTDIGKVETLIKAVKKFRKRTNQQTADISLLVSSTLGIDTKEMQISRQKLSIEENYNDDFKEIHQTIVRRLSKNNDKGLVLLHGKPGTGKTSYIRYLLTKVKKHVIFLPPNMASEITNPELISILIDNPNSIFVIEDAENIVVDREENGQSPVSAILNISDGLLSDCLNIQIICSFNTDLSKVDSALLRKGRLIAKYEFKELDTEKAQKLSSKLGFISAIQSPMTLAAIYNQEDKDFHQMKKIGNIGFKPVAVT